MLRLEGLNLNEQIINVWAWKYVFIINEDKEKLFGVRYFTNNHLAELMVKFEEITSRWCLYQYREITEKLSIVDNNGL